MKIYLTNPLFTDVEQARLHGFKDKFQELGHEVVWPYKLFDQAEVATWGDAASRRIMEVCQGALEG